MCSDQSESPFAATTIVETVKKLVERSKVLTDQLEWIDEQCNAQPLEAEMRIISVTLAAIKEEYGATYFD